MKFSVIKDSYCSDQPEGSLTAHRAKIDDYFNQLGDVEIEEALEEQTMRNFIFNDDRSKKTVRSALVSLYNYYYQSVLKKQTYPPFPIQVRELPSKKVEAKSVPCILEKEEIDQIFQDKFYEWLGDEKAIITAKASMALCLGAGYDTGDFSPSNNVHEVMTLEDVDIQDEYVKVKNYSNQSTVPHIMIRGECAEYIKNYYTVRKNSNVKTNKFICRIWDTRRVPLVEKYSKRKPNAPHELINYVLKSLSHQINLNTVLLASHLRTNMVYHSLLNSNGASLNQIIEVFGFPPFVQYAFEKYCETANQKAHFGFNDFFKQSSSGLYDDESSTDEEKQENVEEKLHTYLLEKRPRDSKKVKQLKTLYDNCCQICGTSLTLLKLISYSEVHHLQPHSPQHNGMDDFPNMLVLCPNHHTLFDLGIIALDPLTNSKILHLDEENPFHLTELKLIRHDLSGVCVRYHHDNIHLQLKKKILI